MAKTPEVPLNKEPEASTVKARVLVAGPHGECNDVIEIDAALAATLAGTIDTDPAAVAYAESLTKE